VSTLYTSSGSDPELYTVFLSKRKKKKKKKRLKTGFSPGGALPTHVLHRKGLLPYDPRDMKIITMRKWAIKITFFVLLLRDKTNEDK